MHGLYELTALNLIIEILTKHQRIISNGDTHLNKDIALESEILLEKLNGLYTNMASPDQIEGIGHTKSML